LRHPLTTDELNQFFSRVAIRQVFGNVALLSYLGSFAEFERSLIREQQREGIALAKKGVYKGRKPSLSAERAAQMRNRANAGENKAALAREFGISRAALYVYLAA
jgi:DNA invertase Pin-like site-specific DNA recombinase